MERTRLLDPFQAHKDDNAILEPSALCVRSALVNKLYCTVVYCEWVSRLHDEDDTFWCAPSLGTVLTQMTQQGLVELEVFLRGILLVRNVDRVVVRLELL